ncbi:hypothetical protein CBR_g39104 [Chara braunii]|uniref:Uncharacterized protein n=1 Tax=Chara braunii TaxID=69332 RepID=A0A388LQW7_CHABU|nr:hypothetical protein CBR_g39104 [Chara braunii]|eukprot:GBG84728.1 hypothetical protein CBR_g39104 [Chara braunii]
MPKWADRTDVSAEGSDRGDVACPWSRPSVKCHHLRQYYRLLTPGESKRSGSAEELRQSSQIRTEPRMTNLPDLRDVATWLQQMIGKSLLRDETHGEDGEEDEGWEQEGENEAGARSSSSSSSADEGDEGRSEGGRRRM